MIDVLPDGRNVIHRIPHNRPPFHLPRMEASAGASIALFSSSTLPHFKAEWLPLAKAQRERGLVIYDVNVRPNSLGDGDFKESLHDWLSVADVVKVSTQDIADIRAKTDSNLDSAISDEVFLRKWMKFGPKLVVVTDGDGPATAFFSKDGFAIVSSRPVAFKDTVGAGDAFDSGVALGLLRAGVTRREQLDALREGDVCHILATGHSVAHQYLSNINAPSYRPVLTAQPRPA